MRNVFRSHLFVFDGLFGKVNFDPSISNRYGKPKNNWLTILTMVHVPCRRGAISCNLFTSLQHSLIVVLSAEFLRFCFFTHTSLYSPALFCRLSSKRNVGWSHTKSSTHSLSRSPKPQHAESLSQSNVGSILSQVFFRNIMRGAIFCGPAELFVFQAQLKTLQEIVIRSHRQFLAHSRV